MLQCICTFGVHACSTSAHACTPKVHMHCNIHTLPHQKYLNNHNFEPLVPHVYNDNDNITLFI